MNKKIYLIANWKCNKSPLEAESFIDDLKAIKDKVPEDNIVVICPSMLSVDRVSNAIQGTQFYCGIQNFFNYDGGAYTGEIALTHILSMNVNFAIIGHSERRDYFGETDEFVNLKTHEALLAGIVPVVCVGESLEQRQSEQTPQIITAQVREAIKDIPHELIPNIVWAYEPLWAIGTGKTATPDDADKVCHLIKEVVSTEIECELGDVDVLYGGSVKAENFYDYVSSVSIDGVLVGGASLNVEQFKKMITTRVVRLKSIQNQPTKRLANR